MKTDIFHGDGALYGVERKKNRPLLEATYTWPQAGKDKHLS